MPFQMRQYIRLNSIIVFVIATRDLQCTYVYKYVLIFIIIVIFRVYSEPKSGSILSWFLIQDRLDLIVRAINRGAL